MRSQAAGGPVCFHARAFGYRRAQRRSPVTMAIPTSDAGRAAISMS